MDHAKKDTFWEGQGSAEQKCSSKEGKRGDGGIEEDGSAHAQAGDQTNFLFGKGLREGLLIDSERS